MVLAFGAAAVLLRIVRQTRADVYPNRPIRVYLPVAAGTGLDVDARAIMEEFLPANRTSGRHRQ